VSFPEFVLVFASGQTHIPQYREAKSWIVLLFYGLKNQGSNLGASTLGHEGRNFVPLSFNQGSLGRRAPGE